MAVALEVRAPFLAKQLVDAALAAPVEHLMPRGERKGLLKSIAQRYLPEEIVDRPKMGFAVPIGEWFRNDFGGLGSMLRDQLAATAPFGPVPVEARAARRLMDEHFRGKGDHGQRLFLLLTLSIWAKEVLRPGG